MTRRPIAVRDTLAALRQDRRGAAAIEFALIVGFLATGILNVVDIVYYTYQPHGGREFRPDGRASGVESLRPDKAAGDDEVHRVERNDH